MKKILLFAILLCMSINSYGFAFIWGANSCTYTAGTDIGACYLISTKNPTPDELSLKAIYTLSDGPTSKEEHTATAKMIQPGKYLIPSDTNSALLSRHVTKIHITLLYKETSIPGCEYDLIPNSKIKPVFELHENFYGFQCLRTS